MGENKQSEVTVDVSGVTRAAGLLSAVAAGPTRSGMVELVVEASDGRLSLGVFSPEDSAQCCMPCVLSGPGFRRILPMDRFLRIFQVLGRGDSVISARSGHVLIEQRSVKFDIYTPPEEPLVVETAIQSPRASFEMDLDAFLATYSAVCHASSSDLGSRMQLCCSLVELHAVDGLVMVATDGRRLMSGKVPTNLTRLGSGVMVESFMISTRSSRLVMALKGVAGGGRLSACFDGSRMSLDVVSEQGSCSVVIRSPGGGYPNWRAVMPNDLSDACIGTFSAERLRPALNRLAAMTDVKAAMVKISCSTEGVKMQCDDPKSAFGEESLAWKSQRTAAAETVGLNLFYLKDWVGHAADDDIAIGVTDRSGPVWLRSGGLTGLIMPMRSQGE